MVMRRELVLVPLSAALVLAAPELAQACGGTFCDNGTQMPVDQTGEDILFIREGNEVEAHVRIAYEGEASRFAWLVPLQALPTITVGSEPLVAQLSRATVPEWRTDYEYECPEDDPNFDSDGDGLSFIQEADAAANGDPEILFEGVVGSFEVIVLQGGTAAEVIAFLQDNDYLQDPESEPILQEYVDEGFLFAAVKLVAGVDVDAIHPLVFRMQADEPCVPIRLTRIAAKQDMGIRAYFLGQDRWVPSNYAHVVLNPLAYDWSVFETLPRYLELLTMAVDEAGGRAFATDYAGSSDVVSIEGVYSESWDEAPFVDADPILALDLIAIQGLNTHPLIQPLLLQFVPPPDGVDPQDFWNNIGSYADQIDLSAWDGPAFAAALSEQIIEPGLHAADLLEAWPKLTRLHTTVSPVEMTVDPTFHANPDLPDFASDVTTLAQVVCGGDAVYSVAVEGMSTPVCVPENTDWPEIAGMPAALKIEQVPMAGPPQVTSDQTQTALALLAAQQATVECAPMGGGETGDGDGDGDGDGTSSSSGQDEVGDDGESGPTYDLPYDTSCGCATSSDQAPLAIGLGLLVLGLIRPRRRS